MLKSISIRALRACDIPALEEINQRLNLFPFPDLESPLYLVKGTVEKDGKVIGAGLIKLTAEAVVILDPAISKKERALALKELFLAGKARAVALGLSQIHAFIKNSQKSFVKVLKKSFNFSQIDDKVLVVNLED